MLDSLDITQKVRLKKITLGSLKLDHTLDSKISSHSDSKIDSRSGF